MQTACSGNKYRCNMGLCVPESTWCDGYLDCPDGSDELPGCNGSKLFFGFHSAIVVTFGMYKANPSISLIKCSCGDS